MRSYILLPILAVSLAACAGMRPNADQRRAAADDLNQSGRPYQGPSIRASSAPADPSGVPLYCHSEGPGTVCNRPGS